MKFFFIIFLSLSYTFSFSQNLLVNGGFEDENICTEFHINCAPEGWISTADTYRNFYKIPGLAHSGQHCVAIEAGNSKKPFTRTYVRTQLLCRLRKGSNYKIEFYVKSRHDILDSAGVYFTSYDFLFERQPLYKITPSLYLSSGLQRPQRGDTSWQKVSLIYSATGNEVYLTLGNFSKRDITGPTSVPLENHFFIFFDDISLVAENPNEKMCDGWQKTRDEIYAFDARHNFLDLYIKTYMKKPPGAPDLGRTTVQTIDTLILPDVFFATDQSELTRRSFRLLDSLSSSLPGRQIDSIVVNGHTDSTGTVGHNKKLSQDRARSVADYIGGKMVVRQQLITARGWGSDKPVAENRTPAGRQQNRRVEIFVYIRH